MVADSSMDRISFFISGKAVIGSAYSFHIKMEIIDGHLLYNNFLLLHNSRVCPYETPFSRQRHIKELTFNSSC
jgi:hypothetical protein